MFDAFAKYNEIPPFVEFGYMPKTTFWGDFGVADVVGGAAAIKDTFNRSFKQFKDDRIYGTELAMVLNHKAWEWDAKNNKELSILYSELFGKIDEYILDHWKGEDLNYYLKTTD